MLTKEDVDYFQEFGYLYPITIMSESDALLLKTEIETAERDYPEDLNPTNRNNPHLVLKCIDRILYHPIIVDAVSDILGPDILSWGSVLFFKEPKSAGYVSWHQDATYMGLEPHNFITPWLALTPSNPECGCLRVIPGSHKQDIEKHSDTFEHDNILTRGQAIEQVDESKAVDLVLKPGQMSIHHARLVHGSMPNGSNHRRMGIALQCYMTPQCVQKIGENLVQVVRGCEGISNVSLLKRPKEDMDDNARSERLRSNENWAQILYHGAEKSRNY